MPFYGAAREFASHRGEIMAAVEDILSTGQALQGTAVVEFEDRVARLTGRAHAVAVNSCTDGLFFALLAAGVKPGDEVLVPDFSFVATASSVLRCGATPVFVDVEDDTLNLDLDRAAELVTERTRAMVAVHLYGQMIDPSRLDAFADRFSLPVVEDAAQAFAASFDGRPGGSVGRVSCMSFDPTKPLSAPGSGGMVLTDDEDIAGQVRLLRYHGKGPGGRFERLGFNSQMPTLTAAVLRVKLAGSEASLARRREIAARYSKGLADLPFITLPEETPGSVHNYHKYVIRSPGRDELRGHLTERGIETFVHYDRPLSDQPLFRGTAPPPSTPVAAAAAGVVLSLPVHAFLDDDEVDAVIDAVRSAPPHEAEETASR